MVWGFSRFVPFRFLGLLRAPTRNSPERVRDTIWTFPKKSGKHPGLETPRFSFSQRVPTRVCRPTKVSTEVPAKVCTRLVGVHLSRSHLFCSSTKTFLISVLPSSVVYHFLTGTFQTSSPRQKEISVFPHRESRLAWPC